jgi:DnaJ domain
MTDRSGAGEEEAGYSAEELFAWASQRLLNGTSTARLVSDLVERGLAPQMAEYFARHTAYETFSARRKHALRLALEGGAWLAGSLLTLLIIHHTTGTWSGDGPWMLGWSVAACGVLRVVGGILALPRGSRSNRARAQLGNIGAPGARTASLVDLQTLGLQRDASPAAIHESYRKLARIWHPDRFADSLGMRMRAEQRMKHINAAYARLSRQEPEQAV